MGFPWGSLKRRDTSRTLILFCIGTGVHLCWASCGYGGNRFGGDPQNSAPRKKPAFQGGQKETEQERGNADGNDARIDAVEIQHLARSLDHIADAFSRVYHLGQNDVGPADIVQSAKRAKDGGKGSAKQQP